MTLNSGTVRAYLDETTETYYARAVEDLKAVVTCTRHLGDQTTTLRFVKCGDVDPRANYNDISSTKLREVMSTKTGVKLREALNWMALSADLLWLCKNSWLDKARLGMGCCIKFDQLPAGISEPDEEYEDPPHFDDPPPLELLGLAEVFEQSPSIEELPTLESPTLQEQLPTVVEPQSLEEPPHTKSRKRHFSATGLDHDPEVLVNPAGGGLGAEGTKV